MSDQAVVHYKVRITPEPFGKVLIDLCNVNWNFFTVKTDGKLIDEDSNINSVTCEACFNKVIPQQHLLIRPKE